MTNDDNNRRPFLRPTPDDVDGMRDAMNTAGTPKGTVRGAGMNGVVAWIRLRVIDRFAFLRSLDKDRNDDHR